MEKQKKGNETQKVIEFTKRDDLKISCAPIFETI